MVIKNWNIKELTGYEPFTTFYTDFSLAEMFDGVTGIKDTYRRAFEGWKHDYKYLTELYMVLNWKIWEHYQTNDKFATLYDTLWRKLGNWCDKHFTKEELAYFYRVTD